MASHGVALAVSARWWPLTQARCETVGIASVMSVGCTASLTRTGSTAARPCAHEALASCDPSYGPARGPAVAMSSAVVASRAGRIRVRSVVRPAINPSCGG
jgi:hypothetical protein